MMNGWIKIHRSLLDWEWWDDANMVHAYMYILLAANTAPYRWHGKEFEAGTFVTSLAKMASSIGMSVHQTRLVLERMESTGEIDVQSTTQYTLVRVCKWEQYQENGTPNGTPTANGRQTDGKQTATDEELKKERNINTPCAGVPARESEPAKPEKGEQVEKETCLTFAQFWDMYGKKVDKEKCCKRFAKVPEKDRAIIAKVLPVYVGSTPEVTYRKNPLTWLNGECWRDEMQAQPDRNPAPKAQQGPQGGGQVLHDYTFEEKERGTGKQAWEA